MAREPVYKAPEANLHRSFVYLDEDLVMNSLSALEAGKIDSIVTKIAEAREGGFGGSISAAAVGVQAGAEGGKKKQLSYEDELMRIRTKFSIFEAWFNTLHQKSAIGELVDPQSWEVSPPRVGDVVQLVGDVKTFAIYPLMRMYLDYAKNSKVPGHPWYVKGEGAKNISRSAEMMKHIFGAEGQMRIPARLDFPDNVGDVAFILGEEKLLGSPAPVEGRYTIVGQVAEILQEDDWSPTLRLMPRAPKSEFERETIREMLASFEDASQTFGVENVESMGEFEGPALILEPIAIFR